MAASPGGSRHRRLSFVFRLASTSGRSSFSPWAAWQPWICVTRAPPRPPTARHRAHLAPAVGPRLEAEKKPLRSVTDDGEMAVDHGPLSVHSRHPLALA